MQGKMTQIAVVALALLTVIGMTATPVLANDTTATNDCDLVDIDGDNNEVAVNMEDSEVNINCGDDGVAGGTDDADDDADDGDEAMTVHVNGDEVDVSDDDAEKQDTEVQDEEVQEPEVQEEEVQEPEQQEDGAEEEGSGDQNVEDDAGDQNVEDDAGDQNVEDDAGDQNVESGEGDQNIESGEGDQQVGGPGDDVQQDFTADEILAILIQQNFIDQSEVNAAIGNGVDNSTIVANIINGDGTIDQSSRFVVDNSTTINNTTIIEIINNTTISDDDVVIENNTVSDDDTTINESGNGSVESGDGDQNIEDDEGDQTLGNNNTNVDDDADDNATDDVNATAPDIGVTKTASADEVELELGTGEFAGLVVSDPVTFTVTVENVGNATATDVVINDDDVIADISGATDTAAFLVTDSSTTQGDFSAATGNFTVGTLVPGDSATLTFDAIVVSTDLSLLDDAVLSLEATNDAELVSVTPDDPNADNDVGSATVTLVNLLGDVVPQGSSVQSANVTATTGSDTGTATGNNTSAALGVPMDSLAFGGLGLFGLLGSVLLLRRD